LRLLHRGCVEQRWAEVAWACAINANVHRAGKSDPVVQPRDCNPLRLAEARAEGESKMTARTRGGLPLDPETVRAFHAALCGRRDRRKKGRSCKAAST